MTLTTYRDLEQGSTAWLEARAGIVTASVVGQLVTAKTLTPARNETARSLTAHLVAERITGHVEDTYMSRDMERGNFEEPLARAKYAEQYAPVEEVGFMVLQRDGLKLGYSPDGLVGSDGLIEVKSRIQRRQVLTVLADKVPAENMAQIQCGLLVSGRKWCDYLSYCGGMHMYPIRVYPDPAWQEAIASAAILFEDNAEQMIATYNERTRNCALTERIDPFEEIVIK